MRSKMVFFGAMVFMVGRVSFGGDMCSAKGAGAAAPSGANYSGVVLETTNASRYTYVQINTGKETLWAAGPAFEVKVGDRVEMGEGMPMKKFKSKGLNRTFDEIYLAGSITLAGCAASGTAAGAGQLPAGHPPVMGKTDAEPGAMKVIEKAAGGKSVAEVWAERSALSGKTVVLLKVGQ